ncbi:MAG: glycosyltransferase [Saprospiraceae bacterium]|nr:glycosyltransferase [Saprospiraceae bacterium]
MAGKKVLIISYYWPPSGGIGVLRCLKIAKYLRQFGWEPVIFTADNAHYPSIDHSNDHDIPPGALILRQRIWEPYHLYKWFTGKPKTANVNNVFYVQENRSDWKHYLSVWLRSNFFIPDARAAWIRPSVRFLTKYLKENPVDAIFSDGPPHSNTRIATLLKKATGIPWLADFQDPWTQVDYYQLLHLTHWGDRRHRRMEQEAFRMADRMTIVSPTWKNDLEQIGARNVSVIPWGFDPDDYQNLPSPAGDKFSITHLGILGYDRNPPALFQVLQELCLSQPGFRQHLEIRLVGQLDPTVLDAVQAAKLEDCTLTPGNVSRQEALQFTSSSEVLLLLLNRQSNAMGRIPGKLFEYIAVARPILVLGSPASDAARIACETSLGHAADYDDTAAIRTAILSMYQDFISRKSALRAPLPDASHPYSIVRLTGQMAALLDEISR